jgi:ABC-type phosphate/phosphonate transport system substrate-binding protein
VPDKDVKTRFAGDHAASIISLWNGKADAAAASEPSMRLLVKSRQIEYCGFPEREIGRARTPAEIQAMFEACPAGWIAPIHYSFPIPGTPFALRADLPADLKAVIKASLLSTPGDAEFIRATKRWYVDPSVDKGLPDLDAYYDSMRAMARLLDLDLRGLH